MYKTTRPIFTIHVLDALLDESQQLKGKFSGDFEVKTDDIHCEKEYFGASDATDEETKF